MVICHEHRFIYIDPPRTGTNTMRHMLSPWTKLERASSYPRPHITIWSPEYDDYYVFITVRSPFSRTVSFWRRLVEVMSHRTDRMRRLLDDGKISFGDYLQEPELISDLKLQRYSEYLANVPKVDQVIHLETLLHDIRKLPFYKHMPKPRHLNRRQNRRPWPSFYDEESVNIVRELFACDFERFRYNSEFQRHADGDYFLP